MQSQVGVQPQVQQPPTQPAYYPPMAPMDVGRLFSGKLIMVFVIVSMILKLIGTVLCDICWGAEDLKTAGATYIAGLITGNIGILLLAMILLLGGILNKEIHSHARLGMIVAAGMLLAWGMQTLLGGLL
ncbi:MAG: hypothetical protein COS08_03915 [Euryarchaeota archaeon CG01_land_8_20_14_3_00_38_12]|nr:MAG: hypothetical protein COS08_03915 [Euryarchaeota archaeon CG01_land_8_20_14_3_00_38_12]